MVLWKGQRHAKWLVVQLGKHGKEDAIEEDRKAAS
jgi:hypothetical protein